MPGYEPSMFISGMINFICLLCTDVYRNPMRLSCTHHLCEECGQRERALGRPCPFCRTPINTLTLDEAMAYEIGASRVHCQNEDYGCTTNISLFGLDIHLEYECAHIPISCSNGCGYRAVDMRGHSVQDCVNGLQVLLKNHQDDCQRMERLSDQRQQESLRLIEITDEVSAERDFAFDYAREQQEELSKIIDDDTEKEESIADLEEQVKQLENDNGKLHDHIDFLNGSLREAYAVNRRQNLLINTLRRELTPLRPFIFEAEHISRHCEEHHMSYIS